MSKKKKSSIDAIVDDLWKFFTSIKVTVALLIVIAVLSMFGTFIQQNSDPSVYIKMYGETGYRIIKTLQLDNLYSAWYFQILLSIFVINLIICSLDRFPPLWRSLKRLSVFTSPDAVRRQPLNAEVDLKEDASPALKLEKVLLARGYKVVRASSQDKILLAAEKGRSSRYGPYITHLGIIVTVIGAMIGGVFGVKGFVQIPEGGFTDSFFETGTGRRIALPFRVYCEDFEIVYYDEERLRPKDYFSKLAIYEDDELVLRKTIEVNHPLKYKGYTFYQSSYQPRSYTVDVAFLMAYADGATKVIKTQYAEKFDLAEGWKAEIVDFYTNFQNFGPVAVIEAHRISPDGNDKDKQESVRFPVFAHPGFSHVKVPGVMDMIMVDYRVEVVSYFTGLQVKKDPGVPVVLIGFVILSIGVFISLAIFHRRIWVVAEKTAKGWKAYVGGWTYKNKSGFEIEFNRIINDIST